MELALIWLAVTLGALMAQNSPKEKSVKSQDQKVDVDLEQVLTAYFAAKQNTSSGKAQ